jgi:hypothetical protein
MSEAIVRMLLDHPELIVQIAVNGGGLAVALVALRIVRVELGALREAIKDLGARMVDAGDRSPLRVVRAPARD